MITIVFASSNQNKLYEINNILSNYSTSSIVMLKNFIPISKKIELISLQQLHYFTDIPEPYETIKENAMAKCLWVYKEFKRPCFSEDTGLFIEALQGEPGVKSARYAGENKNHIDNINKVLNNMQDKPNRRAYFKTVICFMFNDQLTYFTGNTYGQITTETNGNNGFGYDSIFIPDGANCSFAQMTTAEKNQYSHRKQATTQFLDFIVKNYEKIKNNTPQ